MFTPDTFSMFLTQQAWPLGIVVFLVVAVLLLLKISAGSRRARLTRERSHVTEQTFVDHLAQFNFDGRITRTTYRYLQDVQNVHFPILPTDALDEDLGLENDDIEQTIHELLRALKRKEAPGRSHAPIITVEDLVRHLQACPWIRELRVA
jgi:hypothetical protein